MKTLEKFQLLSFKQKPGVALCVRGFEVELNIKKSSITERYCAWHAV